MSQETLKINPAELQSRLDALQVELGDILDNPTVSVFIKRAATKYQQEHRYLVDSLSVSQNQQQLLSGLTGVEAKICDFELRIVTWKEDVELMETRKPQHVPSYTLRIMRT